jgi:vancomycin permeability regulator SanA
MKFENPIQPEQGQVEGVQKNEQGDSYFEKLPKADVVIVPGAELRWHPNKEGEVAPGLDSKMRAIAALELLMNGIVKKIIFTGGVMENEPFKKALAEVSKKYLMEMGIPEDAIVVAEDSKNTSEDMIQGLKAAQKLGATSAYIETVQFHLGRAMQIAKNVQREYGIKDDQLYGINAEELLRHRSAHYERLISYWEIKSAIKKNPKLALKKAAHEVARRGYMFMFDRLDKKGRARARKERGLKK